VYDVVVLQEVRGVELPLVRRHEEAEVGQERVACEPSACTPSLCLEICNPESNSVTNKFGRHTPRIRIRMHADSVTLGFCSGVQHDDIADWRKSADTVQYRSTNTHVKLQPENSLFSREKAPLRIDARNSPLLIDSGLSQSVAMGPSVLRVPRSSPPIRNRSSLLSHGSAHSRSSSASRRFLSLAALSGYFFDVADSVIMMDE
jgi:hypothetical protein